MQKVLESLYRLLAGCKGIMIVEHKKYLIVGNSAWQVQCIEVVNRRKCVFNDKLIPNNELQRGGIIEVLTH